MAAQYDELRLGSAPQILRCQCPLLRVGNQGFRPCLGGGDLAAQLPELRLALGELGLHRCDRDKGQRLRSRERPIGLAAQLPAGEGGDHGCPLTQPGGGPEPRCAPERRAQVLCRGDRHEHAAIIGEPWIERGGLQARCPESGLVGEGKDRLGIADPVHPGVGRKGEVLNTEPGGEQ